MGSTLPDNQLPETQLPDTQLPDTQLPDTQLPDTQLPDTQLPDTQLPDTQLPSVQEFPDRNILIYDGDCRFCLSQVSKIAKWDTETFLAFVALQDPLVAVRFPDLTHEMLMKEMYLVTVDGKRHPGIEAVRTMASHLPRLKWLGFWFRIPFSLSISRFAYRTIARCRYRLWGRVNRCEHGTCDIHFR